MNRKINRIIFSAIGVAIAVMVMSFVYKPTGIKEDKSHKHTYLAIGDQYVIGEAVDEHERWPIQLEASLRNHELHINYPYFVANKSWTADELIKRLDEEEFENHYDLVSIQIGVNDEYKKHSASTFNTNFKNLLTKSIALAGGKHGRVFVLSIPDWSVTPFARRHDSAALTAIADNLVKFNAIIKKEAIAAGCHFVDITDLSKKAATDPTLTAPDGLHPSAGMYKLWIERMYPTVIKALESHRQ